jgi:hypothetical protein
MRWNLKSIRMIVGSSFFAMSLVFLGSGCGGSAKLYPVSGKITLKDKPLTSGTVAFRPDKAKGNTFNGEPIGELNSDGQYTLMTNGKPGAPPGHYKVTVSATGPINEDNTKVAVQQSPINSGFSLEENTPLAVEVVANPAPGAYDFKVGP